MRGLITGAAGFIGSTLAERLLADGHDVVGVDYFTDYYDPAIKRANIAAACADQRFELVEVDLLEADLAPLLDGVDVVYHLAGQPGVRASWGAGFADYASWNISVTQRLLEACRGLALDRFVFSSSSSVYGQAEHFPTAETVLPAPVSPYGVTKLAAEHLARLYGTNFGVPTVSLRYFTVFGPRQRPDMAMTKLVNAALTGGSFPINGDGSQARDFTFVDDVVAANVLAGATPVDRVGEGSVFNVGGGEVTTLAAIIAHIEDIAGHKIALDHQPRAAGDPNRTGADTTAARTQLGWEPRVTVRAGLERQVAAQAALLAR